jgi:hypothetical protein
MKQMTTKDDGGQAFPSTKSSLMRDHMREPHRFTHDYQTVGGMTLRDWFAGQALALLGGRSWGHVEGDKVETWASAAYTLADAMLTERSK